MKKKMKILFVYINLPQSLPWFQVLLHKGFLHSIFHDLLFHVWCTCLLAYTTLLLDCFVCPHNETPNCTHDQIQICTVQPWEAGEFLILFYWFNYRLSAIPPSFIISTALDEWKNGFLFHFWQKYGGKKSSASSSDRRGDWSLTK